MRLLATYELPFPPSVNHYWFRRKDGRGKFIGKAGKAFRSNALAAIWSQHNGKPKTIAEPVALNLDFYPPDNLVRDIDNFCKGVLDSLTHAGVLADDRQVKELASRMNKPAGKPGRLVVEIFEF